MAMQCSGVHSIPSEGLDDKEDLGRPHSPGGGGGGENRSSYYHARRIRMGGGNPNPPPLEFGKIPIQADLLVTRYVLCRNKICSDNQRSKNKIGQWTPERLLPWCAVVTWKKPFLGTGQAGQCG